MVPNHALYQAKLRPEEIVFLHVLRRDSSYTRVRNFEVLALSVAKTNPAVFQDRSFGQPGPCEARMIIVGLMKVLLNRGAGASESRQYSGRLDRLWIPRGSEAPSEA